MNHCKLFFNKHLEIIQLTWWLKRGGGLNKKINPVLWPLFYPLKMTLSPWQHFFWLKPFIYGPNLKIHADFEKSLNHRWISIGADPTMIYHWSGDYSNRGWFKLDYYPGRESLKPQTRAGMNRAGGWCYPPLITSKI